MWSRSWLVVVMLAGGCRQLIGIESPLADDAGSDGHATSDAPSDAPDDAGPDAQMDCLGKAGFEVCYVPMQGAVVLPSDVLNTDTSTACATAGTASFTAASAPKACFIVGKTITIATLSVVGSRPLVLVGVDSITVSNAIDASGHLIGNHGPGAPWSSCPAFAQTPASSASGASGGAGGSMNQAAGYGGHGTGGAPRGISGAQSAQPTFLHAGCDGQAGGAGTSASGAGTAGKAGGALYLLAGSNITLTGAIITVSGAGGGGSTQQGGGGGGGSGGVLVLAAPTINAQAGKLLSNGGGGGGGATATAIGRDGSDPDAQGGVAMGGMGGDDGSGAVGGAGATGGAGTFPQTGIDGSGGGAGGGGGGATGFILASQAITGAYTSPAVAILP